MFLEQINTPIVKKNGTLSQSYTSVYRFQCDQCKKTYDKKNGTFGKTKSGYTFCSRECRNESHSTGVLRDERIKTAIAKYGVSDPMMSPAVQERRRKAFEEKHGEGITCPLHVPGAKEKRRRTHLERYGHEETFQSPAMVEKRRITWLKKYGGHPPVDIDALLSSMERMPTKWSSRPEDACHVMLAAHFGDVVRQKRVHKWPIDFYIPSIDVYIQFDGVYWHGLDRLLSEIVASASKRDKAIHQHWKNDRIQEAWFKEKGLKLIRITDKEFKESGIQKIILTVTT